MVLSSAEIRAKAAEIGFDKVGIVAAEPLAAEGEKFRGWLDRGFHGGMTWLEGEPEKRSDPRLIFPAGRSVIVTALNYYTEHRHISDDRKGKISRYAWGDDYHDIVSEKLKQLLDWMRAEDPSIEGKICVDTAPMMDKAWAERAGIGWIGKSTNLITTELGSWVFLGEIIVNTDLECDQVDRMDHCGTCTACIDACPTDAIVAPYLLDARKCISYATIELRDDTLPELVRDNLDGWIYGCDVCQDVCPWNRFEQPTVEQRFEPRKAETSLGLDVLTNMNHDEYVVRFRKSAIKRAKLSGLKRNASALLENCG
jgi:epoxyqueuosine reductase